MAGPQDIQRYPRGLIDLLGMRATGDTPYQLAQQLISTLDLADFYLFDRLESLVVNMPAAITAVGTQAFLPASIVPSGEIWAVYNYTVSTAATAAATGLTFTPGIFRGYGSLTAFVALSRPMVVPALTGLVEGVSFEKPMLCGPGQQFAISVTQVTGVPAVTPFMTLWFARLKA